MPGYLCMQAGYLHLQNYFFFHTSFFSQWNIYIVMSLKGHRSTSVSGWSTYPVTMFGAVDESRASGMIVHL